MELNPPRVKLEQLNTHRLIPSVYPPIGLFDEVTSGDDLQSILELEGWTNDRISGELGLLHNIPRHEWVVGIPNASAVMAAYCHPHPDGGRFNDADRGAWYAAFDIDTALRETIFHRTRELKEIQAFDTFVQMRQYLSDFMAEFHDIRVGAEYERYHNPDSYVESQALAGSLLGAGSNGIVYRSVRHRGGDCIACFKPPLVLNVRTGAHYEYRWHGSQEPVVTELRI
jgi:hypothetical protein